MSNGLDLAAAQPIHWRGFAAVVAGLFVIFNLNFREMGGVDTIPNTLLPASLVSEGSTDLSGFRPLLREAGLLDSLFVFGSVQERGGHLVSSYPVGAALVVVPLYAIPVWSGWLGDWRDYQWMGKLSAALVVALSAGFLFLAVAQIAGVRAALVLALAYGLGTVAWAVASQAMWQHGPGMLCLSVAYFLALRIETGAGRWAGVLAGAVLGVAVLCRTVNAIPAGAVGLFLLIHHRRHVIAFAVPLVACVTWLLWYNLSTFGDLSGGYDAIFSSAWHRWRGLASDTAFSAPVGRGLVDVLLSPGKGLLVYTPYLSFALAALAPVCFSRSFPLGRYLALSVALLAFLVAKAVIWWGGSTFGPRYLTETLPALTLVLAWLWSWIAARRWRLSFFAALVAYSVSVQILGAFFSPCDWHETPVYVDHHPERLWDWSDTQLERCLSVGFRDGPKPFRLLEPSATRD